ncbi:hypothetical protein LOD99_15691 [Oopsacas minuta]|uniref:Uncharacterized protein n=1 Tax=Oopsacas minuta TaxID=111878 RepID=A0AAV7K9Z7_9METZ|nr:hypothetical protein LOD99_15691 [Oopsacas minuta]
MTEAEEAIYADCPEDDIYADLEDELNKAGYIPEQMSRYQAPALPDRNNTIAAKLPPPSQSPKDVKGSKKQVAAAQQKKKGAKGPPPVTKSNPIGRTTTGPLIPSDMLNQRRLLKKVERMGPDKGETEEQQTDFRSNLRKVKVAKQPPPIVKPKPFKNSYSNTEIGKICYKRVSLSSVDTNEPPAIDRDKKPRIAMDTQDYADDDDDVYDDVTNVVDQDTYDDVENLTAQSNGQEVDLDIYDDVENVADTGIRQPNEQDIYDDVENQNPDLTGEYYDDVENVGIKRRGTSSPELYDDVENVGITPRASSPKGVQGEELYDEVPDSANQMEAACPKKGLTPAQEKKRKAEEMKFRKKQMEMEKKRQKELEKNTKELEKKRKVFFEYYNIKESDKPLMVAQIASLNNLKGKQNLTVDVGEIVHVICKEHKKMPKGAWLAEKPDKSAIGFIAPSILNQNILPTFDDDEQLYSTTD